MSKNCDQRQQEELKEAKQGYNHSFGNVCFIYGNMMETQIRSIVVEIILSSNIAAKSFMFRFGYWSSLVILFRGWKSPQGLQPLLRGLGTM